MSWDVVLLNTTEPISSLEAVDESILEPTNFTEILEASFKQVVKRDNHRELVGEGFSIDFFAADEPASNLMLSLYGEAAMYALVELAKKHGWAIADTALEGLVDLEHPEKNGYAHHQAYVEQIRNSLE